MRQKTGDRRHKTRDLRNETGEEEKFDRRRKTGRLFSDIISEKCCAFNLVGIFYQFLENADQ